MDSIFSAIEDNRIAILGISAVGGLPLLALRYFHEVVRFVETLRAGRLHQKMSDAQGAAAFTRQEIASALKSYVEPHCAQDDPSNESDLRHVAEVREPIMRAVDRFISRGGDRRHILLLADSGMGKTTFALNFYKRQMRAKGSEALSCAVIPLGKDGAIENIRKIQNASSTILVLDAFDEDTGALDGSNGRIQELMSAASDFAAVILTCRSQFFKDDAAIPNETGVSMLGPRRAGQAGAYKFYRLYLLPFNKSQVSTYLHRQFPVWSFIKRSEAKRLVNEVPDLSIRPMLLALIPDLTRSRKNIRELFDLYTFMVDQWLERESRWISKESLLSISKKLAVYMYTGDDGRIIDRVSRSELHDVVSFFGDIDDLKHLTARSLLNRDAAGLYKFAHRSIMEYLFVASAIDGSDACFTRPWTNFMRELFVSWGVEHSSEAETARAREILRMDLRQAQLLPLSAPLPTPKILSPLDLAKSFSSDRRDVKRRRPVPAQWRVDSLRTREENDVLDIFDFEYDLVWKVVRTQNFADEFERNVYRHNIADLHNRLKSNWRLPSSSEFMSLLEAEKTLNAGAILDPTQYYWIGDRLGPARYIVASVSQVPNDERIKPFDVRTSGGQSIPVWLHEVRRVTRRGEQHPFSAMCVTVTSGAEEVWHSQPTASRPPRL